MKRRRRLFFVTNWWELTSDSSRRILESDLNEPSSFLHHLFERGSFLPLSFASLERRESKTSVCTESLRYRRCLVVSVHDTPTEIEAYVSRIEKGDRMDFEMATFRDNFIPRPSWAVCYQLAGQYAFLVRAVARCFLREETAFRGVG